MLNSAGRLKMPLDGQFFVAQPRSSFSVNHRFREIPTSRFNWKRHRGNPGLRSNVVYQSLGDGWKLGDIDADAVQERLNQWLLKTQTFWSEVTAPLVKTGKSKILEHEPRDGFGTEEVFVAEHTVNSRTLNGNLSLAAIVSIEQFSRMNGLTGRKMQKIFEALAPESVRDDARNLVEYCCFRYLSRDSSDIHPCLKDMAFQRLIFITMLAWENPYCKDIDLQATVAEQSFLQKKLVGEAAFLRIAPAIAGVADRSTAHHLFKALVGDDHGISFSLWMSYLTELCRIHQGRESYQIRETSSLSDEQVLCIASSRKRPVLKWEKNFAWPGNLTLTDRTLYFEAIGLTGHRKAVRLDLTQHDIQVDKVKVGPMGSALFDSGVSVSTGPKSEALVLEFVDFGGEMRRDVWHSFISEIISVYKFIHEYGPEKDDPSIHHVYGAHNGKRRAVVSAANSIARLQALQYMRKLFEDPSKLVHFSYLQNVPYGDIVYQTLAVNFWGGPLVTKVRNVDHHSTASGSTEELSNSILHVFDIDGSVYLHKWMRSPTWGSSTSFAFWKNASVRQGLVLSKNLVVADMSLVERAALTYKEKSRIIEKTQATIDAAMLKGIPSNIDLFKELMLPFMVVVKNFDKLKRWEEPPLTISFLAFSYALIFRNMLAYIFPLTLMIAAATMLLLKGLKEQGRLGRSFGKVTIHDQPPSNTIQKIIAIKEAMVDVETYLQNVNVSLLKIRTIVLSGQPQVTTEVALVLLCAATTLLIVPFRYVLAFFLLDIFTRELEFRRETVMRFINLLRERWATIPAAPVVVLPYEGEESGEGYVDGATEQGKVDRTRSNDRRKSTSN